MLQQAYCGLFFCDQIYSIWCIYKFRRDIKNSIVSILLKSFFKILNFSVFEIYKLGILCVFYYSFKKIGVIFDNGNLFKFTALSGHKQGRYNDYSCHEKWSKDSHYNE